MGLGPLVYLMWFAVMLASLVIAVMHLIRSQRHCWWFALSAVIGGLLSWALIFAYIGAEELKGYIGSWAFYTPVAIGVFGLVLFAYSFLQLRQAPRKNGGEQ